MSTRRCVVFVGLPSLALVPFVSYISHVRAPIPDQSYISTLIDVGFIHTHAALFPLSANAGSAGYQHIMNHGKAALATHPLTIPGPDTTVVEDGRFVQENAATVDRPSEGDFIRMEIVEA